MAVVAPMRMVELNYRQRRGRAFFSDSLDEQMLLRAFRGGYFADGDDKVRDRMLRRILSRGDVTAAAHRSALSPDEIHVFLSPPHRDELFACVVISQSRLDELLKKAPVVFESLTLQIANARRLDRLAIEEAILAWTARNYPGLTPKKGRLRLAEAP